MRPAPIALFLAIVLVPLAIAGGLGWKVAHDEEKVGQHQFQALLDDRLRDVQATIARAVEDAERHLVERVIPADRVDVAAFGAEQAALLRALRKSEPLVREVFVLDGDGVLLFPPARAEQASASGATAASSATAANSASGATAASSATAAPAALLDASAEELAFRQRTMAIWRGDAVLYDQPAPESLPGGNAGVEKSATAAPPARKSPAREAPGTLVADARASGDSVLALARMREKGWIAWYWEEGLHLLLWRRLAGSGVIGVEVDRVVLLSRIIARLPAADLADGRVALFDSRGHVMHQWGPYQPAARESPAVSVAVPEPLSSWRLAHFASPAQRQAMLGTTLRFQLVTGLVALALGLLAMAFVFYRDYARRLRDASQRVSFVTQVSHELKTPLTNIRLYAELLSGNLDDDDDKGQQRVRVIIAESQRLGRLINNILTFAKKRRGEVAAPPAWIELDAVVREVLEQFEPALVAKGITRTITTDSDARVHADPDAIGQIVANLVSNVEKYAASGGVIEVITGRRDGGAYLRVSDRGPGIAPAHRDKIFRPFYRVSDKLADGVTGTGIGLAIARELAEKNGATLRLVASDPPTGACFELWFASTDARGDTGAPEGEGQRAPRRADAPGEDPPA